MTKKDKVFYTHDFNGETINLNAKIFQADSLEEAEDFLLRGWIDLEQSIKPRLAVGSFSDCWIKSYNKPEADETFSDINDHTGLSVEDCFVQTPGTHPGGDCYWITPRVDIHVLILEQAGY